MGWLLSFRSQRGHHRMHPPTTHTTPRRGSNPAGGTERQRTVHVVGGGHVGRTLVERLLAAGDLACLVDDTIDVVTAAAAAGVPVVEGDPTDPTVLDAAGLAEADVVVAATSSDRANLLVAQLARARFGVTTVLVRVNDPDRVETFRSLDYETVCVASNVGEALAGRLR